MTTKSTTKNHNNDIAIPLHFIEKNSSKSQNHIIVKNILLVKQEVVASYCTIKYKQVAVVIHVLSNQYKVTFIQ